MHEWGFKFGETKLKVPPRKPVPVWFTRYRYASGGGSEGSVRRRGRTAGPGPAGRDGCRGGHALLPLDALLVLLRGLPLTHNAPRHKKLCLIQCRTGLRILRARTTALLFLLCFTFVSFLLCTSLMKWRLLKPTVVFF